MESIFSFVAEAYEQQDESTIGEKKDGGKGEAALNPPSWLIFSKDVWCQGRGEER